MTRIPVLAAIVACAGIGRAASAHTVYFGLDSPRGALTNSRRTEAEFLSALHAYGVETFDALPSNRNDPPLAFGAIGVTASTLQLTTVIAEFGPPLAITPPNSLQDGPLWEAFSLSRPVHAFGTYLVDLGQGATPNRLTIELANVTLRTSTFIEVGPFGPNAQRYDVAYFGIIDAEMPFNFVQVLAANNDDVFHYDDLTVGYVPEPTGPWGWVVALAWSAIHVRRLELTWGAECKDVDPPRIPKLRVFGYLRGGVVNGPTMKNRVGVSTMAMSPLSFSFTKKGFVGAPGSEVTPRKEFAARS